MTTSYIIMCLEYGIVIMYLTFPRVVISLMSANLSSGLFHVFLTTQISHALFLSMQVSNSINKSPPLSKETHRKEVCAIGQSYDRAEKRTTRDLLINKIKS